MGRHSWDDDPAPRLPERPHEVRRPANRVGPPTPRPTGPRPPARSPFPDRTTVLPPVRDFPTPDDRSTTGLRRPALQPGEDPANAHRRTDGIRRPDPINRSGAFPVVPRSRTSPSGGYPVTPANPAAASGRHPAVPGSRPPASGAYPVVRGEDSAPHGFRVPPDGADVPMPPRSRTGPTSTDRPVSKLTSTGERGGTTTGASRATSTGTSRPVSRLTSTGTHKPVATPEARAKPEERAGAEAPAKPEGRATTTGGTRTDGRSTASGTHRAIGKVRGRKRIAKWPIFTGVFVVLLVIGLVAWGWANSVVNSRADAQAAACTDGNSTLSVVVTPSVQQPIRAAADRWNQAKTVVHAHCVHVDVRAIPSPQVLDALTGKAGPETIGGFPAAWVPENTAWINQLVTARPGIVGSPSESVASGPSADYPYIGLADSTVDEVQARAAQVFRDYLRDPQQRGDFAAAGLAGN